jgi:hypothetical protein
MTSLINPCSVESHHALPAYFAAAVSSTRSPRYRSPATKAQVRRSAFAKWAGDRLENAAKPLSQEPLSEELLGRVLLEGEAMLLQRWQGAQQGDRGQISVVVHARVPLIRHRRLLVCAGREIATRNCRSNGGVAAGVAA